MKHGESIRKWMLFTAGLFIMSFGVALSVKANLGVSPVSCIPYIISLRFPLTLGMMTIIFSGILILLQIVLLGRRYKPSQLLQIVIVVIFGFFIDLAVFLISDLTVDLYIWRFLMCIFSCVILGFGVFLEVKAGIGYLPGEGLALAISDTFGMEFGKAKVLVDSTMVGTGIICSFVLLEDFAGIREGTVIAAMLVGVAARYFSRNVRILNKFVSADAG